MNADELNETNEFLAGSAPEMVALLDEYLELLKTGEEPNREDFLAQHPEHADQLRNCLASLDFLSKERDDLLGKTQVDDFRIIEEIGQGGMGTVYRAEQLSLGRTVALKIMRAGRQSAEAIDRFQREAETVAALHHTNIVPIFSVGVESEINYFAMQLIEGQSLSEVSRNSSEPIDPKQAAEWALDVTEALAHAHERGVVHRDVKPSNILLDQAGGIWLSDFGLAKRSDDLTLSVTGAILGTPRYMSPEQARGAANGVDERSDIYSVGATLYELVTKSPVFEAESPHKIIGKIIHDDPTPPTSLDSSLPHDLETILLKCLQKQPADRYQTAIALADDLRAFIEDRPISSRPIGTVEKCSRWLRKKRSAMTTTAIAAVATLLVTLLGLTIEGWRELNATTEYRFNADVPGAVAEFFDQDGQPIGSPISLPTQEPVSMRCGKQTVQVSAPGRFSLKRPVELTFFRNLMGATRSPEITFNLNSQIVGPPIPFEKSYEVLPGQGRILTIDTLGLACHDVRSGVVQWRSNVDQWEMVKQSVPHFLWEWPDNEGFEVDYPNQRPPSVATDVGDLDHDGVHDFVLTAQHSNWLVAVSSRRGQPLWANSFAGEKADDSKTQRNARHRIVGAPVVVDDIDGDQVKDLIAIAGRWQTSLAAFSGRSGKKIWTATEFEIDAEELDRAAPHPVQLATVDGKQVAVVVIGKHLRVFNLRSGENSHSGSFSAESDYQPLVQDIDGDGSSEVILRPRISPQPNAPNAAKVEAWSIKAESQISSIDTYGRVGLNPKSTWSALQFADIDNAEECEVVRTDSQHGHLLIVEDLKGNRIWERVLKNESTAGQPAIPFLIGPDIDADGNRDIFVASLWQYERFDESGYLFVDAFSGNDGHKLWSSSTKVRGRKLRNFFIHSLTWWKQSDQDWPTLVVTSHPERYLKNDGLAFTTCFAAGDGELLHVADGVAKAESIDVDGDHIEDLAAYSYERFREGRKVQNRHVTLVPGRGKTEWTRPGGYPVATPASDLNSDGVDDLVQTRQLSVRAISGGDGSTLWNKSSFGTFQSHQLYVPPNDMPMDIDKDGVQDLLCIGIPMPQWGNQPLCVALSGATGRQIWKCSVNVTDVGIIPLIELQDLDADGIQEIIFVASIEIGPDQVSRGSGLMHTYAANYPRAGLKMLVLNQSSGALLWKQQLGQSGEKYLERSQSSEPEPNRLGKPYDFDINYIDANNDGVLDVVAPLQPESAPFALRVLDGRNGEPTHPVRHLRDIKELHELPRTAVVDLDGSGEREIVSASVDPFANAMKISVEATTAEGESLWQWNSAFPDVLMARGSAFQDPYRATPTVLRHPTGTRLAINVLGTKNSIAILDASGKTVDEPIPLENIDRDFRIWAVDVDSDGWDELLAVDDGYLKAYSFTPDRKVLWQREVFDQYDQFAELAIESRPTANGQTELVVRAKSNEHRLMGLAPRDGSVRWTCPLEVGSEAVTLASKGTSVRVVETSDYVMYARDGVALTNETPTPEVSPTLAKPPGRDIRNKRYLPWARLRASDWLRTLPLLFGWSLFNTMALLIIPFVTLRRLIRDRQWSMRTLLMLPVVASIFFLAVIVFRTTPVREKLTLAILFLPFVAYALHQFRLLRNHQWLRSLLWVLVAAIACVPMVAMYLFTSPRTYYPGDYLAFDYWYVGLPVGAWAAGLLIVLQWAISSMSRHWQAWISAGTIANPEALNDQANE